MPDRFQFTSPLEERIFKRLSLLGPGPAAFYADACRLMQQANTFATTSHLVGHLLREIESGLRVVLGIVVPLPPKGSGNSHKVSIAAILAALGIAESDPVAQTWLGLAGENAQGGLARRAHRDNLRAPREVDDAFVNAWADFQRVLDEVLDRLEGRYAAYYERLDDFLTRAAPSESDLKQLKEGIPYTARTRYYFFSRLMEAGWLVPLHEGGFFRSLPEQEEDSDGRVGFPGWPEAEYLLRVAAINATTVREILAEINTDNVRAQSQAIDVALKLPAAVAASLGDKFLSWTPRLIEFHFSESPVQFATAIAEADHATLAERFCRLLLSTPERDATTGQLPASERPTYRSPDSEWATNEVFTELVPALLNASPAAAIDMLADALDYHVGRPRRKIGPDDAPNSALIELDTSATEDLSKWWLDSVADPETDGPSDARLTFAIALRDGITSVLSLRLLTLEHIVDALGSRTPLVFQRLMLNAIRSRLSDDADSALPIAIRFLTNEALVDESTHWIEYGELFAAALPLVDEQDRIRLMAVADRGPRCEWIDDETDRASRIDRWRRDTLTPVLEFLTQEWRDRVAAIVVREGPAVSLKIPRGSSSWVGPTSPKTAADIESLSVAEIVEFVRGWKPDGGWESPSAEGLGRALQEVVANDPARFANGADKFRDLSATYVRALISGLRDALQNERGFDWSPVLSLGEWITEQPVPLADIDTSGARDEDPDWRWCRKELASLVGRGLFPRDEQPVAEATSLVIARAEQVRVWRIISVLATDENPTPAYEEKYGGESMDPGTMALNTVRPEAITAAIRYGRWLQQDSKRRPESAIRSVPELAQLLANHLEIDVDASAAVRAAYGFALGHLIWMDEEWVRQHIAKLFPSAPNEIHLHEAVWDSFIQWGWVGPHVLPTLSSALFSAIDRTRSERSGRRTERADLCLGERLMPLYWWGTITLTQSDSSIVRLFDAAHPKVRERTLEFVGRSLLRSEKPVATEVVDRLKELWDWRFQRIEREIRSHQGHDTPSELRKEAATFGLWFVSAALDDAWSIDRLRSALRLSGEIDDDVQVLERLTQLAPSHPLSAVECMALYDPTGGARPWRSMLWIKPARKLLEAVIMAQDVDATQAAKLVINRWAAAGHTEFRDLL